MIVSVNLNLRRVGDDLNEAQYGGELVKGELDKEELVKRELVKGELVKTELEKDLVKG